MDETDDGRNILIQNCDNTCIVSLKRNAVFLSVYRGRKVIMVIKRGRERERVFSFRNFYRSFFRSIALREENFINTRYPKNVVDDSSELIIDVNKSSFLYFSFELSPFPSPPPIVNL